MKSKIVTLATVAFAALATSCVDDKYDLSDIDTTVRVNVDHLVVPINIDAIDLSSIIDLKEDGIIKVVNGEYCVVKEGTINSNQVRVNPITLNAPYINPSVDELSAMPLTHVDVDFNVESQPTSFNFVSNYVSSDILGIDKVVAPISLTMNLTINPNPGGTITIKNLMIQMPKGLLIDGADYDKSTGVYKAHDIQVVGGKASLVINAKGVDLTYYPGSFNANTHVISISDSMYFMGGTMECRNSTLYDKINLRIDYSFTDIHVEAIDGVIEYKITGVNVPRVEINDLPDVLSQPGTNVSLVNPVIYMTVTNPLGSLNLYATSGVSITPYRNGVATGSYPMDETVMIDASMGDVKFYMSPLALSASAIDPAYASAHHYTYSSLGKILSGDGLPQSLGIDLIDPKVPNQKVYNFVIGKDYGEVHGNYRFVAPIQLADGSVIRYTDKVDGWSSEDLDYLTIEQLDVNLTVSSDVPLALEFTGYPIDVNGNRINNVSIVGADIDANAQNQNVTVSITGEITHLDGIEFVATAKSAANAAALSPDMKLHITNLRPCATGYYQKEL